MKLMTDKIEEVLELERETSFLVKINKKNLEKDNGKNNLETKPRTQ